ncbi:ankyrin repeat domain-containing protein 27 [Chaetomidium leptoderma]|uniref:Ankyrin repeat domain-containing protein 27 n=1 Tax=Chaetomidium leptoderma TaxID=669021 RepID=A0AAN6VLE6_9PEZI|nr:ankyrin repeat domain-containing protein 27 [Chaetomidium leptoderma]
MAITPHESHQIAVHAGQGQIIKLTNFVKKLAKRENTSIAQVLLGCKDDFQQTAAHIAAKAGQIRSIEALARLLGSSENSATYFNLANRFTGDRPVHTAMRHGFLGVLKVLVANGADPTAKNRFGDMVVDYLGDFEPEEVLRVVEEYNTKERGRLRTTQRIGLCSLV